MPRVYTVAKARASKRPRTCRTCGHKIEPGESYRYFEPRYGPPVMYCAEHHPKRGDMTTSKLGTLYNAQDDFNSAGCETLEDLTEALAELASTANEIADEYQESVDAMPEGLQEGHVAQEMLEKIEALQSYASELEDFDPDVEEIEEFDEEQVGKDLAQEHYGIDDPADLEEDDRVEWVGHLQEARDEWESDHEESNTEVLDNARSEADDLVSNFDY